MTQSVCAVAAAPNATLEQLYAKLQELSADRKVALVAQFNALQTQHEVLAQAMHLHAQGGSEASLEAANLSLEGAMKTVNARQADIKFIDDARAAIIEQIKSTPGALVVSCILSCGCSLRLTPWYCCNRAISWQLQAKVRVAACPMVCHLSAACGCGRCCAPYAHDLSVCITPPA